MNTFAGLMLLVWVAGWTLAMVRADLKARALAIAAPSGKRFPGKSAITAG